MDTNCEWVRHDSLRPWPGNPRRHSPEQLAELRRSLQELGWGRPIVARRSDRAILAGHGVWAASAEDWPEVLVRWVDLDDAAARAMIATDNRLADSSSWDRDLLADLLVGLPSVPGYSAEELAALIALPHVAEYEQHLAADGEVLPGAAGAVWRLADDWTAPRVGRWELSALRADRILPAPEVVPEVRDKRRNPAGRLVIAGSAEVAPGDIFATYTEDSYFCKYYDDPANAFAALFRRTPGGLIGFDFSTWGDWPFAARLWALHRSYWCTRYAQELGLAVWPNIRWLPEDLEASVAPIPRGVYCALCLHTKDSARTYYLEMMGEVMRAVAPSGLLVYCDPEKRGVQLDLLRGIVPRVDVVLPAYVWRRRKK